MVLLAVIIGYILGVMPNIVKILLELKESKKIKAEEVNATKEEAEIYSEWLNGAKIGDSKEKDQAEIFKEYLRGE